MHTTIGGVIGTTTGTLAKNGSGTLTLSAANTYTGATTVNAGIVRVQNATSLGTTATGTTVVSGATIEIDGSGLTIAEPITSLIGTGVGGNGALRNLANNNTWSGVITLGAGGATIAADAGLLTTAAIGGATQPLTVAGAGDTTIGGVVSITIRHPHQERVQPPPIRLTAADQHVHRGEDAERRSRIDRGRCGTRHSARVADPWSCDDRERHPRDDRDLHAQRQPRDRAGRVRHDLGRDEHDAHVQRHHGG